MGSSRDIHNSASAVNGENNQQKYSILYSVQRKQSQPSIFWLISLSATFVFPEMALVSGEQAVGSRVHSFKNRKFSILTDKQHQTNRLVCRGCQNEA